MSDAPDTTESELELLRARVSELEGQLEQQARATNAIVARSQEKLYWLERWHIDLDHLMEKPGAELVLSTLKPMRALARRARQLTRVITGRR